MSRENNFDLIRLFAALQVMLFHGLEHLLPGNDARTWLAWFPGLPIFFFISGFLITAALGRSPSISSYARNRARRIFPALWVCLVAATVLATALGSPFVSRPTPLGIGAWWYAQMSFLQFYNPSWLRGFGTGVLNGSLWSIPVELQFYVLLPILYWIADRSGRRGPVLALTSLLSLGASVGIGELLSGNESSTSGKLATVSLLPYLYMFLVGTLLYSYFDWLRPWLAGKGHWWLGAYLVACWLGEYWGWRAGTNLPHPLLAVLLGITTVSMAFTLPDLAKRLLKGHDLSYGIYIVHMPVFNALLALGLGGSAGWMLAGSLVVPGLAWLSWRYVERPFLGRRQG